MNPLARDLVETLKSLGTLPTVYSKVNELVNDPNCPAAKLGDCISNDQAITSMILRLVNSALYGYPTYIDTVTKAVTIVGFKQTRDLVLASSVIDMFGKEGSAGGIDYRGFWKHSIATAVCSKIIASHMKKCDQEAMFTAGLLHDIGRLISFEMSDKLPIQDLLDQVQNTETLLYKNERKMLGFTHMDLAEALFCKWNLPPLLKESAVYHHVPALAPRFKLEASCIHIADAITHSLRMGFSGDKFVPEISEEAWQNLEIPISKLPGIVSTLKEQYPDLIKLFFTED